jgi:hypothetical protein
MFPKTGFSYVHGLSRIGTETGVKKRAFSELPVLCGRLIGTASSHYKNAQSYQPLIQNASLSGTKKNALSRDIGTLCSGTEIILDKKMMENQ